jgi:hypothetical protein
MTGKARVVAVVKWVVVMDGKAMACNKSSSKTRAED